MRVYSSCLFLLACAFLGFTYSQTLKPDETALFPVIFNLASHASIKANATCGENEPEVFCKLVEHVRIFPAENLHCDVCDLRGNNRKQMHPISNAINGRNTWWQSPSITNGRQLNFVTVDLDLGQVYQIAYIILKAANAPRPGNWILEKSIDGITYTPWQYFAISDGECREFYNVQPAIGVPKFTRDDQVICTSRYSRLDPLENGEIFVSLVNGRPGVEEPSQTLLDFTSARYIRIRLQKIRTLHADLMTFQNNKNLKDLDPTVTRRYFYSIKDISIGGQCICYGHARLCRPKDGNRTNLQCQCEHNTCGKNCEECCPGFNQKQWGRGKNGNGFQCEACNCHGQASDCVYNSTIAALGLSLNKQGQYDGGGVCINCQDNTSGVNCETCIEGYYRPAGIAATADQPCRRCNCQETQTSTSRCLPDDTKQHEDLEPGDCICKPSFGGKRCERCQFGYYDYPNCKPCPCNPAGSANPEICDRRCVCKRNVEGVNCDQCRPGYFNLDRKNPNGCTKCFCFGATTTCNSTDWGKSQVTEMNGWVLTTRMTDGLTLLPRSFNSWLEAKTYILSGNDVEGTSTWPITGTDIHYWLAPMVFTGNRLSSYGGMLKFTIKYILDSSFEQKYHLSEPDIIIEGGGMMITNGQQYLREEVENRVSIRLVESEWRKLSSVNNRLVEDTLSKGDMMTVLQSLMRVMIRATYHTAQDTVFLRDVSLDVVSPTSSNDITISSVEKCQCPPGYAGLSCESCAPSWRRQNGVLYNGVCLQCNCNQHSSDCNDTGACLNCRHYTTGKNCERCITGYYGDPRRGSEDDCQPCACPMRNTENNFGDGCVYSPTLDNRFDYQCMDCMMGYAGKHCELCAPGYYGNPMMLGGSCKLCQCSGNINMDEASSCNNVTGECQQCDHNTEGIYCNRCKSGYYGSALNGDCTACNCNVDGSYNSYTCQQNGQCSCRPRYQGLQCNDCQVGYWKSNDGRGCLSCDCSLIGSRSNECDTRTGRCTCRQGIGGRQCDQCLHGYYGFDYNGCRECEPCTKRGHICDSVSGRCVCPPLTTGLSCERCEDYSWGYDPRTGCQSCNCSSHGSRVKQCNKDTGACLCESNYEGYSCDQCLYGYYNFPVCDRCNCNSNGTKQESCNSQAVCQCNYSGQCQCKLNVEGRRCDNCKRNSFGFDLTNPYGCTQCFCFGRSQTCQQSSYAWTTISLPVQRILINPSAEHMVYKFLGYDAIATGIKSVKVPENDVNNILYWSLPEAMLGDKILSYNGKLDIVHYFESSYHNSSYSKDVPPVAIIIGNGIKIHYVENLTLESANPQGFSIQLHEYYWRQPGSINPISRALMMVVLQNIEAIFIPATSDGKANYAELGPVGLQIAKPVQGAGMGVASGVEYCTCPKRYSGDSCQNPGEGYYRDRNNAMSSRPETIIGDVKPCHCNNHADKCDINTGKCINCADNTYGKNCELCAPGYHGISIRGTSRDCVPCACPGTDRQNNFSPTCESRNGKLVCTNCSLGYEGERCERCIVGYYGNPSKPGDVCKPCLCNPEGSVFSECDRMSGRCHCLPGIGGLKCNLCEPGYAVQNGSCTSCFSGCTGLLLSDLQYFNVTLLNFNISVPLPWNLLRKIKNTTNILMELLKSANYQGSKEFTEYENSTKFFEEVAMRLVNRVVYIQEKSLETAEIVDNTYRNSTQLENRIKNMFGGIKDDAKKLVSLMQKLILDKVGLNMTAALEEAKTIYRNIQDWTNYISDSKAYDEKWLAEKLLERVIDKNEMNFNGNEVTKKINDALTSLKDLRERSKYSRRTAKRVIDKESARLATILRNLEHKIKEAVDLKGDAGNLIKDGKFYIKGARDHLDRLRENYIALERKESSLDTTANILDQSYYNLNKLLSQSAEYVRSAWEHARKLEDTARNLDRLFSKTRADAKLPLKAAKVYSNIVGAINQAKNASTIALQTSRSTVGISNVNGLRNDVTKSIEKSKRLQEKATMTKEQGIQGLNGRMVLVQGDVNGIMMKNQANRDMLRMVNIDLDNLPKDLHNKIDEISGRAMDVNRQVDNTSGRIEGTIDKISKELEPELKKLRDVDMKALINHIQLSTQNASDNVNNLKNLTEIVIDSSKQAKRLNADVSGKILRLREKIRLAREIANDMKLSLSGNGECFRSFRSVSQPSTANSIDFAFKVNKTVKDEDMLLVLLQKSRKEYMALELRNKFVHFRWNVGSGEGLVIHDQEVTMASDEAVEQDRWYRVTAKRIGRIGLLKVKSMARLAPETKERNASSSIGSSLLKFDFSTAVYLAGYPNKYNVAPDISSNKLVGCIGDVYIDDEKVGVFNFKNSESSCQACVEVPSEPISSNIYHFDGTGYSSLHRGRYRDDKIYISFSFKTYWENAILHFSGDEMGDFMSVELVGGKVVLQYYMGGISIGRNKTNKTYNTNKWVKVNVDRNKLNALLTVDNERIFISAQPGKTGLDLKDSPMFFGGIPKSLDISKFQKISPIENTNLLGCMKDVSVGAISADVQNLFTGNYVGMTAGCKDSGVRTIGFYGDGYSMYEGQSLISGDTDISVSFVTKKPDALLLLSTDIPQLNYYSLSVKNGIIIAQFTVDSVGVSLVSNYSFNDGFLHNIGIIKSGRRVALMVNDEKHMERRLPSGATAIVIGADGSLYLGGTQRGFTVGSNVPTTQKLDGCLSNIIINGGLIALDKPKQYERADIGRCSYDVSPFQKQDEDKESKFFTKESSIPINRPEETTTAATTTTTTTTDTTTTTTLPSTNKPELTTAQKQETTTKKVECATSPLLDFYSGATSFGNTDASYAQIKVKRRDISKSFNISFDFRTFYPDALFGFLTNADHSDYIAAQLKDGYIHVSYIRSGPYSTSSNNRYDDGQWHSVYITKDRRDLDFIVDGVEIRQGRIRAKLDIDAPIYIGGLPDDFQHSNTEVVRNSLRGCMKNLIINKDQINLADTKIISGVGQCYRDVEKGAYFTGTSWGAYSNNVRVKKDFSIELYFKTQKSNGVLLTSSTDDLISAVAIEIVNGQVKFTMKNGVFFITVQSKIGKEFHYCDRKWHRVQARLFESNIGLRIDKDPENIASSPEEFKYFETRSPLIIGGIARIFPAQGATSITVGYTGCMRDITIDNQPIGWYDLIDFNGIRRTACPQQ